MAALQQPSPFRPRAWPEPDVSFLVETLVAWRKHLPGLANAQRSILRSVATALSPVESALQEHRATSAQKVASNKKPACVSCMTSLLRWPNAQQGKHLVVGYPIVGEVAPSGVFRPISQPSKLPVDAWLGPPAEEAVDRILRRSRPRTSVAPS